MTKKTDSKADATTSVVVTEKRLIGQPGVIAIGGVILEPIAQFNKVNGPIVHNDILLIDYGFQWVGDRDGKLSLYSYTVRNKEVGKAVDLFILADELSSLDIEAPEYLDFQDDSFSTIVLVNSSSRNDYFRGIVVLVNVDTGENAFNNSIIEMRGYFYGEDRQSPLTRRIAISDIDADKLKFQGRQLPPGSYYNSDLIENTFVRGELENDERGVQVRDSTVSWSHFREGEIIIRDASINHSSFLFTGDVLLTRVTVDNEHFGQLPSIYLASKFDLTTIDVAGKNPARMIRIDVDRVIITLPTGGEKYIAGTTNHVLCTMPFRNPRSRRGLRNQVNDVLFGDTMPSEMEESVVDYFVDTVLSRCSMMNLVDSARRLLSGNLIGVKEGSPVRLRGGMGPMQREQSTPLDPTTLGSLSPRLDARTFDGYGVTAEQAIENARAIYIDGKNF